ncbi:MAG: hypothetical protein GY930_08620 [bacterium]|nr:hypothetical protein [bacterium]
MQTQKRPHWREDFTVAEHAFKEWRTARKKGARIPHDLWQLALDLAKRHSVAKVAVTLGLMTRWLIAKKIPTRMA